MCGIAAYPDPRIPSFSISVRKDKRMSRSPRWAVTAAVCPNKKVEHLQELPVRDALPSRPRLVGDDEVELRQNGNVLADGTETGERTLVRTGLLRAVPYPPQVPVSPRP